MQSPFDSPLSGFRSPFGSRRLATAFNALMLFQNGEQGVVFDPNPDTCFTDTAGTTPAGVGDAVALMLDKSQGAGYSGGSFTGLGPELMTNGGFETENLDDWSTVNALISVVSEQMAVEAATDFGGAVYDLSASTAAGKAYIIKAELLSGTGRFTVEDGSSGDPTFSNFNSIGPKTFSGVVIRDSPNVFEIRLRTSTSGQTTIWDNISVRELPGYHATQPTAAARPIRGRVPDGGRRNLLTRTEEFDHSDWAKTNVTVSANNDQVETTSTGIIRATQTISISAGAEITLRAEARPISAGDKRYLILAASDTLDSNTWFAATFDVDVGVVSSSDARGTGFSVTSTSIEAADDGRYLCKITGIAGAATNIQVNYTIGEQSNFYPSFGRGTQSYTGDGVSGLNITKAQLATDDGPYQRVGSTYDVTEAGKADKWYLLDDAVDDVLNATLPDLGTDATVAYASDQGVTILTGQTIGAGDFDVLRDEQLFGMVIVDRALTAAETTSVTTYLEGNSP